MLVRQVRNRRERMRSVLVGNQSHDGEATDPSGFVVVLERRREMSSSAPGRLLFAVITCSCAWC